MTVAVDRARGRHAPSGSEGLAKWWGVLFHVAATMPAPVRTSPPVATLGVADGVADLAPPQRPFRHHARRQCRAQMARSREERGGATVREGRP